jgi:hypothetical protein
MDAGAVTPEGVDHGGVSTMSSVAVVGLYPYPCGVVRIGRWGMLVLAAVQQRQLLDHV